MSGNTARLNAIAKVQDYELTEYVDGSPVEIQDDYGCNVFNEGVMKTRLPNGIYESLKAAMEAGSPIDKSIADVVASAMKDWAVEKGVTHYTHIFYPLTGGTAEKHDAFFQPDSRGKSILEFTGSLLCQGEPDASSFPSGGIRQTHEARGYTAWDVSSPAYIVENPNGATLFIPTVFISWTGEALDKKTALLRSNKALNKQVVRLLRLLGESEISLVESYAGAEQEYFLIDTAFYHSRPDLLASDRTLFGNLPPKGQEFDDHYFGCIQERVLSFMMDVEAELYKLAIPVKTRHNEVAPGQFEIAPVYEDSNLASDHQQMIMQMVKKVANRHGLTAIFHEKPFAGLNGSGKHLNWSLGNSTQGNFLNPGKKPSENKRFLVFCVAIMRMINKYQGLMRAMIASAANDHRLGANEAPPAIMSVFVGKQLADIFGQIKDGKLKVSEAGGTIDLGLNSVIVLDKDAGDRNRTSPFAFTGNRFEFRAVGSSQTISDPLVFLNTALADSLEYISDRLEEKKSLDKVLQEIVRENDKIIFNGDGYSPKWHKEAVQERGLKNLRTTPEALLEYKSSDTIKLFENQKVLSKRELFARYEVLAEQYVMKVNVESNLVLKMGRTLILPAGFRYQTELADSIATLRTVGVKAESSILFDLTSLVKSLQSDLALLAEFKQKVFKDIQKEAEYVCGTILPHLLKIRETVDSLEEIVADDLWPLASYQEMLFIK